MLNQISFFPFVGHSSIDCKHLQVPSLHTKQKQPKKNKYEQNT